MSSTTKGTLTVGDYVDIANEANEKLLQNLIENYGEKGAFIKRVQNISPAAVRIILTLAAERMEAQTDER